MFQEFDQGETNNCQEERVTKMKRKKGFLLRRIADRIVVVPFDECLNLNLMITLNDTGAFLWECLESDTTEQELVSALMDVYEVEEEQAKKDVAAFLLALTDNNFLE